jgi:glucosamine kinase
MAGEPGAARRLPTDGPRSGRGEAGPANIASDPAGLRATSVGHRTGALGQAVAPDTQICRGWAGPGPTCRREHDGGWPKPCPYAIAAAGDRCHDRPWRAWRSTGSGGHRHGVGLCQYSAAGRSGNTAAGGFLLGDEGSGPGLAVRFLARALRAHGRVRADDAAAEAGAGRHGGPAGLSAFAFTARPVDFAALAPRACWHRPGGGGDPCRAGARSPAMLDTLQAGTRSACGVPWGLGAALCPPPGQTRWPMLPPLAPRWTGR